MLAVMMVLLLSAGCAQYYSSGTPTFTAEPAAPAGSAVSETGYDRSLATERTTNRTVETSDDDVTVRVTSQVREYRRSVEVAGERRPVARVGVLSTPEVRVFRDTYSPVEGLSDRELVDRLQREDGRIEGVRREGRRNVTVLGEKRTVSEFTGTATVDGRSVEVFVDVVTVRDPTSDGADYVVAVAVYPQALPDERQRVDTLLAGIEHPPGSE